MSTNVEMRVTLPHALNDLLQLAGAIGSMRTGGQHRSLGFGCEGVARVPPEKGPGQAAQLPAAPVGPCGPPDFASMGPRQ